MIPTLFTERLTLRPSRLADFPAYCGFIGGPRSRYMGGPHDAQTAWAWFCNDTASWSFYGFGGLTIEAGGAAVGMTGITHGPGFPEPELGWLLFDGAEGQGYAAEAAGALRDHLAPALPSLVSYIDPGNTRAIRLAERLGARPDEAAATPSGGGCRVWRHDIGAGA